MNPKVLCVLHLPPPIHGASTVGKYIKDSYLINNKFCCRYVNLGISNRLEEIGRNGLFKWLRFFCVLGKIFWYVVVFRPVFVYMTPSAKSGGFYKDAVVALLLKGLGQKIVYHFHNKGIQHRSDFIIDDWLYKNVFRNSEIILLSKYLYSDIEKYVGRVRVHYCFNGIPSTVCPVSENKKNTPSPNTSVSILFLSNLFISKGLFVLLQACALLKSREVLFNCIIVGGTGDVTPDLLKRELDKLGLNDCVNYAGKMYGADKQIALSDADIFTLPTFYEYECFPLVLLEAMQFYLPVVTTSEGGIQDIVDDRQTGFLVEKNNPLDLADKLELLIRSKELRERMGSSGNEKFNRMFTIEHFEKKMCEIFDELLAAYK